MRFPSTPLRFVAPLRVSPDSRGKSIRQETAQRRHARRTQCSWRRNKMEGDRRQRPVAHDDFEATSFDIFVHREFRLDRQTEAGSQGRRQRVGVVGAQPSRRCDRCLLARRSVREVPTIRIRQVGVAQTGMRSKIARVAGATIPVEIARRSYEQAPHLAEPSRPQAGVRERGNPQCEIEPAAYHIHERVTQMQIDGDLGVTPQELGQDWRDMGKPEGHGRGEPHESSWQSGLCHRLGFGRFRLGQELPCAFRGAAARLRQGKATRCAVEQTCAEAALETADRFRNRAFGHPKLVSRAAKRAAFGNFAEDRPSLQIG